MHFLDQAKIYLKSGGGGPGDGFKARHVGSETGHRDLALAIAYHLGQTVQQITFRAGIAGRKDIGGIANDRQHPFLAKLL